MAYRSLSSFEKKILAQTLSNERNGTIFGATYARGRALDTDSMDDSATLTTLRESRLTLAQVTRALALLLRRYPELRATVNSKLEFEPLQLIKTQDVVSTVEFDSIRDEKINCHAHAAPPYLVPHILNHSKFVPGKGLPLWQLYVVDESLVLFHGQDVLFDIFSAAQFHKCFLAALNDSERSGPELATLYDAATDNLSTTGAGSSPATFHKSIYDNLKIFWPSSDPDLLNRQTQSFFKSIYFNTLNLPRGLMNMDMDHRLKKFKTKYNDMLGSESSLSGTTVFGMVPHKRFEYLHSIVNQQNICLRSFICGITMICLKPMIKDFTGTIVFAIPVNLRDDIPEASTFGLFYKDVRVECPLSYVDDSRYKHITENSAASDLECEERLLEEQFKAVTQHVCRTLAQRKKTWEKTGFNDDDIKRMKYSNQNKIPNQHLIQINDVSEIALGSNSEINDDSKFSIKGSGFTRSLPPNALMSLSYTHCENKGLNICIHYPNGYNMESFVECFQSFIDE